MEVEVMKKTRSMIATLGMGILSVALAVFTNGCSCFFPCEKTESETPVVPVKAEQEKKACPKQQTVKKETEKTVKKTGEAVTKTVEAKKEEVKKAVETKAPDIAPTVSSVWTLELNTLKGAERSWEEPAKNITLIYDPHKKQIAGCAGVNRYFGPATIDETKKTFKAGALGVTRMAGPGMKYENLFLNVLSKVDSYAIKDGKLMLKAGPDTVAVFMTGVKATK